MQAESGKGLKIGGQAIAFTLPGIDDQEHSLSDYQDKEMLILVFMCNHCPYVQAYLDRIIQIQTDYGEKGVQVIGINANDAVKYPDDSFENMKVFAAERGINFPYLRDDSQQVPKKYGAQCTPEVFVLDRQRKLRYHGRVDDNMEEPEQATPILRNALNALLAGKEIATKESIAIGCSVKWK